MMAETRAGLFFLWMQRDRNTATAVAPADSGYISSKGTRKEYLLRSSFVFVEVNFRKELDKLTGPKDESGPDVSIYPF
jgi:hypothetical protein